MMNPIQILSLKALSPSAHRIALAAGAKVTEVEVIQTVPRNLDEEMKKFLSEDVWMFTSFQAINALERELKRMDLTGKTIYCVGNRAASFFLGRAKEVIFADDAEALVKLMHQNKLPRVAYFRGNLSLPIVENALRSSGTHLNSAVVYDTHLINPVIDHLDQYDIVLFFSPSGVESFSKNQSIPAGKLVGAIGKTTAGAIQYPDLVIASEPTAEKLIEETIYHFKVHVEHQE